MRNRNDGDHAKTPVNVASLERVASTSAGALLLYNGLHKINKSTPIKLVAAGFLLYRGMSGHCPLYSAVGKNKLPDPVKNINIRTSLTVNKPRTEVYDFWRRLENLPLFMKHLDSVQSLDNERSEWKAKIPGGLGTIKWEATIVKDEPGQLLGWSSLPHADIENAGKITFKDAGAKGTEIHVVITYRAPLGRVGTGLSKLFTPLFEKMIKNDVANFKRYIETGEVPTTDGQPRGRRSHKP
jgi:uncharacterized membrane protein